MPDPYSVSNLQASTGRAPGRADKEALRPLYVRYWRLKCALAAATGQPCEALGSPMATAAGGEAPTAAQPQMMEA